MKTPLRSALLASSALWLLALTAGTGQLDAQTDGALTLADCLRESLAANHVLLGRSAESEAARARASGASAAARPRLFLLSGAQHTTDPYRLQAATANNQAGIFTRDTLQAAVGASLPLYSGGRISAEADAARLLAEAASGDLTFARQALAVRVVAIYQDALALRAVLGALDQSRATLTAQAERIDALLRQQKAAGVDLLRVSVRLARVDQASIEARNRLEIAKATLAVLMGREPSAAWELADTLALPTESPAIAEATLGARADEVAAQARADSAAQQVRAARAGWLPSIDGFAAYGPRVDLDGGESFDSGSIGVFASWSLWDFGRTKSRLAEARATLQAREEAASETTLQRRLELANAEADVRAAAARIEASRLAVEQAQEAHRIEQLKYELGQGTITDVLDAQAAANEAESLRARALADHAISLAARDFAAGLIFTRAAATPVLQADPLPSTDDASPSKP